MERLLGGSSSSDWRTRSLDPEGRTNHYYVGFDEELAGSPSASIQIQDWKRRISDQNADETTFQQIYEEIQALDFTKLEPADYHELGRIQASLFLKTDGQKADWRDIAPLIDIAISANVFFDMVTATVGPLGHFCELEDANLQDLRHKLTDLCSATYRIKASLDSPLMKDVRGKLEQLWREMEFLADAPKIQKRLSTLCNLGTTCLARTSQQASNQELLKQRFEHYHGGIVEKAALAAKSRPNSKSIRQMAMDYIERVAEDFDRHHVLTGGEHLAAGTRFYVLLRDSSTAVATTTVNFTACLFIRTPTTSQQFNIRYSIAREDLPESAAAFNQQFRADLSKHYPGKPGLEMIQDADLVSVTRPDPKELRQYVNSLESQAGYTGFLYPIAADQASSFSGGN